MASYNQKPYSSYLLRMWQEGSSKAPTWRASLESVQTGDLLTFRSLHEVACYLHHQTMQAARQYSNQQQNEEVQ